MNRGGCWASDAKYCRSACRARYFPDGHGSYIGLRVVIEEE
ncbi:MAG: hypothetical protein Q4C70_00595 [Planctomycetia bacterium]|nr:hypothetical protein [Planctomycetia bacterium]